MPTEETDISHIVFNNPNAVAELEAAISKVFVIKRDNCEIDGAFDLKRWEHWLALITWTVDEGGRTQARILVPCDKGEATMVIFPFSVTMYRPMTDQTDVCLCFAKLPEDFSPREVYNALAVPLGGAFSSATRMAMEDAIENMGGLKLGVKEVADLPALPAGTWVSNPFDGKTEIILETEKGRRRGEIVAWYHGKIVRFDGGNPPLNTRIKARVLREDFRTITACWMAGDGHMAATPIVRRKTNGDKPAQPKDETTDAKPPRQRRGRSKSDVPAVESAPEDTGQAPADFEEPAGQTDESAPEGEAPATG